MAKNAAAPKKVAIRRKAKPLIDLRPIAVRTLSEMEGTLLAVMDASELSAQVDPRYVMLARPLFQSAFSILKQAF